MTGRILVINPNSSQTVTQAIDRALDPLRIPGGPTIHVTDLPQGPPGIATQRDADSVVTPLATLVETDPADAFVLACFSDPGLHTIREAANGRPVMGIGEWGMLRALTLGERFGIVALSEASVRRQQRAVRQAGLQSRYAGSCPIHATAADTTSNDLQTRLAQAAQTLVQTHGADVIILGCAGMATHRTALQSTCARPVVEPTQQATAAALTTVLLNRAAGAATVQTTSDRRPFNASGDDEEAHP